jgi:hypothetical protein
MCHQVMIFLQLGTYKLADYYFCLIMLYLTLISNNDTLVMNLQTLQIKFVVMFIAGYFIWFIKYWFFFQLGTYSHKLILLIWCLVAFASDQWHISDEYKTASNGSCHNLFLLVIVYDLSNDDFFFLTWDLMNFINFFQLGNQVILWSMMHLWWFWDISKSNLLWRIVCWGFFFCVRIHQGFFPFNLCKKLHVFVFLGGITH